MKKLPLTMTLYLTTRNPLPADVREIGWDDFIEYYVGLKWKATAAKKGKKYGTKLELPLWSPVTLKKGTVRANENVERVHALCLDFDSGDDLEDIDSVWGDYLMTCHTTWGNTPDKARARCILPLSRPVTRKEFGVLIRWAMKHSEKGGLRPDPACKDAARAWYLPAPAPEFEANYRWIAYYDGEEDRLDVDALLKSQTAELSKRTADDIEFTTMDGSPIWVKEWAAKTDIGAKVKGACPYKEGSSLGSAFLRKCEDGALLVCTSSGHGHPKNPHTVFFSTGEKKQHRKDREEGGPEVDVLELLDQNTHRGNPTGVPKATQSNLIYILESDTRWKGRLWKNTFSGDVMCDGDSRWSDVDDTKLLVWLDRVYGAVWPTQTVRQAVEMHAEACARNPLQEWLTGLQWDGVNRVDNWLVHGFGSEDNEFNRLLGRKWIIQAVARAIKPGCQADATLVLVGRQGAGKSTGLRALAGNEYFSDTPLDFSKDSFQQIRKAWIYEIAELDAFRGRAHSQIKGFLTASSDLYREPYKVRAEMVLRHVVFAGTTNEESFLTDSTGSRRFFPVRTNYVSRKWIVENRVNLWAEAYFYFMQGEKWYLNAAEEEALADLQQPFQVNDAWEEVIAQWLQSSMADAFTIERVMGEALQLHPYQMDKKKQMRIAETLRRLGYLQKRDYEGGKRRRVWVRPERQDEVEL